MCLREVLLARLLKGNFWGFVCGCFSIFLGECFAFEAEFWAISMPFLLIMRMVGINFGLKVILFWPLCFLKQILWMYLEKWGMSGIGLYLSQKMVFRFSHAFREANYYADKLANLRIMNRDKMWWTSYHNYFDFWCIEMFWGYLFTDSLNWVSVLCFLLFSFFNNVLLFLRKFHLK